MMPRCPAPPQFIVRGMHTSASALSDPDALSPSQWAARLAALSRTRAADDRDVVACREALAYWRCRRVIDEEAAQMNSQGRALLVSELRGAVGGPDGTLCQSGRPRSPLTERAVR